LNVVKIEWPLWTGRLAEPLEIAKLAVYLALDDSAYIVGADFAIDGGAGAFSQLGG